MFAPFWLILSPLRKSKIENRPSSLAFRRDTLFRPYLSIIVFSILGQIFASSENLAEREGFDYFVRSAFGHSRTA
jgi:hypothetical protein